MFFRLFVVPAALALGLAVGVFVPAVSDGLRHALASPQLAWLEPWTGGLRSKAAGGQAEAHGHGGHAHGPGEKHAEGPEGAIVITAERIAAANISTEPVQAGTLARRLSVPGTLTPDPDRIGRVAAKVVGTVAELKKRLGEPVAKGEIVAVLDSREVADAKGDLRAALVNLGLQRTLFEREKTLWDKRVSAEQQFIRARNAFTEAELRVDLARQKLSALGLDDVEIANLDKQVTSTMRRYELRAPLAGRVVERRVDLGAPVGGEGQEKELYVIADLSSLWVDLAVPTADLELVREGQAVTVVAGASGHRADAEIVFISPMLDKDTRAARVIAALANPDLAWRPGTFVSAEVLIEQHAVDLRVPRSALQTIGKEQVVFVRTPEGFEKREVVLGKGDAEAVEIVFGLDPGETIATRNTFLLKADLGKSEAEHGHAH